MDAYTLKATFDIADIVTESVWLVSAIAVFAAVCQLYHTYREKVWLIPLAGGMLYLLGAIIDLLDEFYRLPNWLDNSVENQSKLIGYMLFSVGFVLLTRRLARLGVTDPLTGVHNRRSLIEATRREIERAKRTESKFSLIFIDVDKFKKINDRLGHTVGDAVLRDIADKMQENIRSVDLLARFGGDEFVILMPDTTQEEGLRGLLRIRQAVDQLALPDHKKVHVSLGIAQFPDDSEDIHQLLALASKNMYKDKDKNQNQQGTGNEKPA